MLYTDTDSFFLYFEVEDIAAALDPLSDEFDFSEVPEDCDSGLDNLACEQTAGQVGYFKDEMKGAPIIEFVALRPKMYSFKSCDVELHMGELHKYFPNGIYPYTMNYHHKAVAKGISRSVIKTLAHDDYKRM